MAYGSWDDIERGYREILTYDGIRAIYLDHAAGMLDLLPEIRQNSAFGDVIPYTSHLMLYLELKAHRLRVRIWYEQGKYEIVLYDPEADKQYFDNRRTVVPKTAAVNAIHRLLDYVRSDETSPEDV